MGHRSDSQMVTGQLKAWFEDYNSFQSLIAFSDATVAVLGRKIGNLKLPVVLEMVIRPFLNIPKIQVEIQFT